MVYQPEIVPQDAGSPALQEYLAREFARLASTFERLENLFLNPLAVAPTKPETGQVIYANGTNFNPGNGAGFYGRVGSTWVKLGIGTGDDLTLDDLTADQITATMLTANGLQFPSSAVLSSNVNNLDDYSEESWTPSYVPSSGAFSAITYDASRAGVLTKIGNLVIFNARLLTDSVTIGTAAGQLKIGGLPYASTGAQGGGAFISFVSGFAVNAPWFGLVAGTEIFLYHKTSITSNATATQTATDMTAGASVDANFVSIHGFYRTLG